MQYEDPTIQRATTDYSKFRLHEHNRVVMAEGGSLQPRADLLKSMREQGFREECPVIGYINEDGTVTIIDGHNRFATAAYLGLPVPYIAYKRNGKGEFNPVAFSITQKSWSLNDVVKAYASQGTPEYIELLEYCERTSINIASAASMFMGELASSGNTRKKVKAGSLKIKDRQFPETVALITNEIGKFVKWNTTRNLVYAISRCLFVPEFHVDRFLTKLNTHYYLLEKQRTMDAYVGLIELIYNRSSRGDYLYLKMEADRQAAARNKCHGTHKAK